MSPCGECGVECSCDEEVTSVKPDLVILFSGGADSVLLHLLARDMGKTPLFVLIDYQQLHREELEYAQRYIKKQCLPYRIVMLHNLGITSGLTGSGAKGRFEGVHTMHVPSRNLMFISIAASIAEDLGIDTIWHGADWSDYLNEFPDCKQEWFGRVNKVLQINGPKPIKLEAPLCGLSKENIMTLLKQAEVEIGEIFSGYGSL
jgi:7-cyano-7-deazaguanine synthase